ncbi:MAG: DUF6629 family protein [Rhodomicrobium sp.]
MCFSATASFSAASITAVIGIATLRQVKEPHELLLAAMPLLFALQQAIEGALWLQLPGGNGGAAAALSLSFVVFAKVLWPAYTPLAVLLIEPDLRRRQALSAIAVAGCALSIYVFNRLIHNPPAAAIYGHSIDYGGDENALSYQSFVYLLCACVPLLLSSSGAIQNFGAIVLAGFAVSAYTYFATFISVWCFFAAAGSSLLYFYFKRAAVRARAT